MLWLHSGENAVQKCELVSWCTSLAHNPGLQQAARLGDSTRTVPAVPHILTCTHGLSDTHTHTQIQPCHRDGPLKLITATWWAKKQQVVSDPVEISKDILLVVSLNCISVFVYEHMHIYLCSWPCRAAYKCYGQNRTTKCNFLCPVNAEILIRLRKSMKL